METLERLEKVKLTEREVISEYNRENNLLISQYIWNFIIIFTFIYNLVKLFHVGFFFQVIKLLYSISKLLHSVSL